MLVLAGPGVLKRSLCNNEDELISLEPIADVHPLMYFGFEEHGKTYGFDIRTIVDALHRTCTNPFTRQPLSIECRKRLRAVYGYRLRRRVDNYYEHNLPRTPELLLQNRWTQVCQMIEENGFFDIHPNLFRGLSKSQLYVLLSMIYSDMQAWSSENKSSLKRIKYLFWIKKTLKKFSRPAENQYYSFTTATLFCILLYDCVDSYNISFIIMSALYKL
jgi:hypothetical protein